MEILVNGKKIDDLNKEIVKIRNKIKFPISEVALYSLLEDARLKGLKVFFLNKVIKGRKKVPTFTY